MIFQISNQTSRMIKEQTHGKLIYQLNLLTDTNDGYRIETSLVVDCVTFLSYKETSILPDGLVEKTVHLLEKLGVKKADFYPSFYEDCLIDSSPITVRVTNTNVHNALTAIYDRWFDGKPYVQRKIRHLEDKNTYPAVLIQPHYSQEQSMITRHPRTGKLMQGNDGIGIVHCSKSTLNNIEENVISTLDQILSRPFKIYYYADDNHQCLTIRRIVPYPMTADARIFYTLSKHKYDEAHTEDLLCFIQPEDISTFSYRRYLFTSKQQFTGLDSAGVDGFKGNVVFPWTDPNVLISIESPVFLSTEAGPEDVEMIKKCRGAVFSRGGMTSHGAVICRALGKKCISGSSDLLFDYNLKHAFVIIRKQNDENAEQNYRVIKEGDPICIYADKWSLEGDLIPDDQYIPTSTLEARKTIANILKPYTEEKRLESLSLEKQMHIALLIKALKGTGWKL